MLKRCEEECDYDWARCCLSHGHEGSCEFGGLRDFGSKGSLKKWHASLLVAHERLRAGKLEANAVYKALQEAIATHVAEKVALAGRVVALKKEVAELREHLARERQNYNAGLIKRIYD